jgi:hypothetical protein
MFRLSAEARMKLSICAADKEISLMKEENRNQVNSS